MRLHTLPLCLCSLLVLAACQPPPQDPATRSEPDTKPVAAQRAAAPAPAPAPSEATSEAAESGVPLEHSPAAAAPPADAAAAATLVRDYYAAINAKDYARAYGMWSEQGKASGQTAEQFANGYASTERVQADVGMPGNAEGAAGSRYLQVPVTVHSVRSGGEQRTYAGHFVLRAVVADGAPVSARQWHLYSAELRRKTP